MLGERVSDERRREIERKRERKRVFVCLFGTERYTHTDSR